MAYHRSIVLFALATLAAPCVAQVVFTSADQRSAGVVALDQCRRSTLIDRYLLLRPGDSVILHQTQSTNADVEGAIQWCIVDTVINYEVFFRTAIDSAFDGSFGCQLVVPLSAPYASVADTLYVQRWNGVNGGVLILQCADSLLLRGLISAAGCGEIGRRSSTDSRDTAALGATPPTTRNGGARNAGGAGGSARGSGGSGGYQTDAFTPADVGGRPVAPWRTYAPALRVGGAGGGGHQNDRRSSRGGSGGGVVLINTPRIIGSGAIIDASGESAAPSTDDGSGGGGAGGTVWLNCRSVPNDLIVDVRGGNGGNIRNSIHLYGPGGGGGGGDVYARQSVSINTSTVGGNAGRNITHNEADRGVHGAEDGAAGAIFDLIAIPRGKLYRTRVGLRQIATNDDGTMCTITALGAVSVRWRTPVTSTSAASDTVIADATTTSVVVAELVTEEGCVVIDSVRLKVVASAPVITVSFDNATAKPGDTVDVFLQVRSSQALPRDVSGIAFCSARATTLQMFRASIVQGTPYTAKAIPFKLLANRRSTFRREQARVALGDSLVIALRVDSVVVDADSAIIRRVNGQFTLDGVCIDQQPRLVDTYGGSIRVEGRVIEAAADDIRVVDVLGRSIPHMSGRNGSLMTIHIPTTVRGAIFVTFFFGRTTLTRSYILD